MHFPLYTLALYYFSLLGCLRKNHSMLYKIIYPIKKSPILGIFICTIILQQIDSILWWLPSHESYDMRVCENDSDYFGVGLLYESERMPSYNEE
jgi:hypothetical protein